MAYNLCDQIWAGPYPNRSTIEWLTANRVTSFVNLTRRDEKIFYGVRSYKKLLPPGVTYQRFPLWTPWLPELGSLLRIVRVIESSAPVYFHCRHGLDRTGVTAMLVLMNRGMAMDQALEHLNRVRTAAGENSFSPRKPHHFEYLRKAGRILRYARTEYREGGHSTMLRDEAAPVSARQIAKDIRNGLNISELKTRYKCSGNQLRKLLTSLVDGGFIEESELDKRLPGWDAIEIPKDGLPQESGSRSLKEVEIRADTTRQLKVGIDGALRDGADRIVVTHRRAKRAHRAVTGIRDLTPDKLGRLAAAIATGNLVTIGTILMSLGVGPLKLRAIQKVGIKRSYELARYYREAEYVESPRHADRKCVMERDR